jgi:regulatory protein
MPWRQSRNPDETPQTPPDPAALREYALRLLAMQSRSETEIARKLARRGADPEAIAALLDDFRQRGWLDDQALAERWVEARGQSRGRGALAWELRRRGVDPSDALSERTDDDEKSAAWTAAVRKAGDPPTVAGPDGKRKLAAFLQRRGFSYNTVRHVLDRTVVEKPSDLSEEDTSIEEEPWESD